MSCSVPPPSKGELSGGLTVPTAAVSTPAYPLGLPNSRRFFSFCPLRQKSVMSWEARPISGARRRRPPRAASGPIASIRWGASRRGCSTQAQEPARCQVQLRRTEPADLYFTREFAAFPLASLLPSPSTSLSFVLCAWMP